MESAPKELLRYFLPKMPILVKRDLCFLDCKNASARLFFCSIGFMKFSGCTIIGGPLDYGDSPMWNVTGVPS